MVNLFKIDIFYFRFDLPVDGGTIVQLEFLRYPTKQFSALHYLYVPVNQIVNMGDFYLFDSKQKSTPSMLAPSSSTDLGGAPSPSPIGHDLWISTIYSRSIKNWTNENEAGLINKLCVQGHLHDPMSFDLRPLIQLDNTNEESSQFGLDSSTVCLDKSNLVCVRNGALIYSFSLKVSFPILYLSYRLIFFLKY